MVRWIRPSWRFGQLELLVGVGVTGSLAADHLDQRADPGQGVADLVGDPGGEEAERGHLLLLDHPSLGGPKRGGPLGDALFEFGPVPSRAPSSALQAAPRWR